MPLLETAISGSAALAAGQISSLVVRDTSRRQRRAVVSNITAGSAAVSGDLHGRLGNFEMEITLRADGIRWANLAATCLLSAATALSPKALLATLPAAAYVRQLRRHFPADFSQIVFSQRQKILPCRVTSPQT